LHAILPRIHCILFKSAYFRGFPAFLKHLFSSIMGVASSPLWGPSSCILSTTCVFCTFWNRMYPFYNIFSPFKWLQQIPGSKYRILAKLTQIMGVASSPLWGPRSCILSTTCCNVRVLESDVPILQYAQFFQMDTFNSF